MDLLPFVLDHRTAVVTTFAIAGFLFCGALESVGLYALVCIYRWADRPISCVLTILATIVLAAYTAFLINIYIGLVGALCFFLLSR